MKFMKLFLIVVALIIMITAICVASFGDLKPKGEINVWSVTKYMIKFNIEKGWYQL